MSASPRGARFAVAGITGANKKTKERRRKFLSLVAFLLGMEGGLKGEGMPGTGS